MDSVSAIRTDAHQHDTVSAYCLESLKRVLPPGIQFWNVVQDATIKRQAYNLWVNMLGALNQCPPGVVFCVEFDCLYPQGYFDWEPPAGEISRSADGWLFDGEGFWMRGGVTESTLCADRDVLRGAVWRQLEDWPNHRRIFNDQATHVRQLDTPFVDIRHGRNWTGGRHATSRRECVPYWGDAATLRRAIGAWD
jgi:hypothetical protein